MYLSFVFRQNIKLKDKDIAHALTPTKYESEVSQLYK